MLATCSKVHERLILSIPHGTRLFTSSDIHQSQLSGMTDMLIQVDENDRVLGSLPKLESHLASAITNGTIHRAFSVFLFGSNDHSLLIQKRARTKIVFPREWANTCCSHPLHQEDEMNTLHNVGVKRAASKRLKGELGISDFPPESFTFKGKILYRELSPGGVFGESEVDYILFARTRRDSGTVIIPEPHEVEEIKWISPGPRGDRTRNLKDFLKYESSRGFPPTPWFNLMINDRNCLDTWWDSMIEDSETFFKTEHDGPIRKFI